MAGVSKIVLGASIKRAQYSLRKLKEVSQMRVVFFDLALIDSTKTYELLAGYLVGCVLVE